MPTRVVHCKREPYDVYIGRPGPWGNPFEIGKDGDRRAVLIKYRDFLFAHPGIVRRAKRELKGKTLGCWCKPHDCHGDVLKAFMEGVFKDTPATRTNCNKVPFMSREEAEGRMDLLKRKYRARKRMTYLNAYRCDIDGCGAWHLTSTPLKKYLEALAR